MSRSASGKYKGNKCSYKYLKNVCKFSSNKKKCVREKQRKCK